MIMDSKQIPLSRSQQDEFLALLDEAQKPSNSHFTNNTDPNTLLNKFRDILQNESVKVEHLCFFDRLF